MKMSRVERSVCSTAGTLYAKARSMPIDYRMVGYMGTTIQPADTHIELALGLVCGRGLLASNRVLDYWVSVKKKFKFGYSKKLFS